MSRSEVEVSFLLVCGHHNVAFLDNWTSDNTQCRISILRLTSSPSFTLSCAPSRIISEAHTTFRYCCPPVCLLLVCVQDSERSGPNKLARMSLLTTDPILTQIRKTTWRNTRIVNMLTARQRTKCQSLLAVLTKDAFLTCSEKKKLNNHRKGCTYSWGLFVSVSSFQRRGESKYKI